MLKKKHAIIIATDFLQAYGLKVVLQEYFSPKQVEIVSEMTALDSHPLNGDVLFVQAAVLYAVFERVASIRNKLIILSDGTIDDSVGGFPVLKTSLEQTAFLDRLNELLVDKLEQQKTHDSKLDLSDREREVLALIAKGEMNKTIADKLNISLNTVLTHRKNITAKLDIKTVSGLTVYAILNGLISAEEV